MNLQKLFESLDEKVFTPELKESLESQFNEAVEMKAASIADERIEEEINSLNEKAEKHIDFLNEKAEEYVKVKQQEMVDSLDKYLERVVEEFVNDLKETLTESVKSEKAEMIIEAFDSMLIATGVKISEIVEAKNSSSLEKKLEESIEKYDALVEENINLSQENKNLIKMGLINEMKEDLSLIESEKFEKLANLVQFTKDEEFVSKLETIKESIKGSAEVKDEKSKDADLTEGQVKPVWAHLV